MKQQCGIPSLIFKILSFFQICHQLCFTLYSIIFGFFVFFTNLILFHPVFRSSQKPTRKQWFHIFLASFSKKTRSPYDFFWRAMWPFSSLEISLQNSTHQKNFSGQIFIYQNEKFFVAKLWNKSSIEITNERRLLDANYRH